MCVCVFYVSLSLCVWERERERWWCPAIMTYWRYIETCDTQKNKVEHWETFSWTYLHGVGSEGALIAMMTCPRPCEGLGEGASQWSLKEFSLFPSYTATSQHFDWRVSRPTKIQPPVFLARTHSFSVGRIAPRLFLEMRFDVYYLHPSIPPRVPCSSLLGALQLSKRMLFTFLNVLFILI